MNNYGKSIFYQMEEIQRIYNQYHDMVTLTIMNQMLYGFAECWCKHPPSVHYGNEMPVEANKIYPCQISGCECQCVAPDNLTYIEIMAKEKRLV
jgi:hypothetical protein